MNQSIRTGLMWGVIILAIVLVGQTVFEYQKTTRMIFSEFLHRLDENVEILEHNRESENKRDKRITRVLIKNNGELVVHGPDGTYVTYDPGYEDLIEDLRAGWVIIETEKKYGSLVMGLLSWIPLMIFLAAMWFLVIRQMMGGGTKAMSFGKSKAKLLTQEQKRVTFADVAGVNEPKEELEEIIEFLKDPKKFQRLGGRIPKGVLLMGAPGTGKTLLAKAVAGEAEVPFFSISGSDFVEMFVGVGASRVRDLFEQGKKAAPCIVFIDEIDAVGRHRGAGLGGGHDEREQTLNQLLVEMDGFEPNDEVILISATNRPDVLDPALLRPGRFDRRIVVSGPDVKGREGILKVHAVKIPLASDVDMAVLARSSPGFSGADLANLVNEAALRAARFNKMKVEMADFEFAKDKVMMGSERRSLVMSEKEKETIAYHEAGHALVAVIVPEADPLHKVSVIPRGMALGLTQQLPLEDRFTHARNSLDATLQVLAGGRLAEELILGAEFACTGAARDIEQATELARKMVCEWGMSEAMGPLSFGKREEAIFLGKEFSRHQDYSEATAVQIDSEISRLVQEATEVSRAILKEHRDALEAISAALLEHEVLDGEEIIKIIQAHTDIDVSAIKMTSLPPDTDSDSGTEPDTGTDTGTDTDSGTDSGVIGKTDPPAEVVETA